MAASTKKASIKTATNKSKICLKCSAEKPLAKFYVSYSEMHSDNKVPICKECLLSMVNVEDVESVKDIMRQIDRPFLLNMWESALKEDREPFGTYMKNISMHQHRTKTWKDSQFSDPESTVSDPSGGDHLFLQQNVSAFNITQEIVHKWGAGYSAEEYQRMEIFAKEMGEDYEIETTSHKDYLKKITLVSISMDRAIASGHIDQFKKLSDTYDKLMRSAKFTAVQRSAADRTGGLNTFSEFSEMAEKRGFIPVFATESPDIVDLTLSNLKEFTRRLVLGDPNLSNIVEESIQKMQEKEASMDEDAEVNNFEDEEDYSLEIADDEVGEHQDEGEV